MDNLPIILLAAGQSSRMRGGDKLLEIVERRPLLRRQALRALDASQHVLIALPPRPHPRYDVVADIGAKLITVENPAEGMNASLRTAVAALPADAEAAMILLADLPDLTAEDLCHVRDRVDPNSGHKVWRGTTADGRPGHPVVFAASLFPALRALTGDSGAGSVIKAAGDAICLIPLAGERARKDLDTPEEWAAWRKLNARPEDR